MKKAACAYEKQPSPVRDSRIRWMGIQLARENETAPDGQFLPRLVAVLLGWTHQRKHVVCANRIVEYDQSLASAFTFGLL